MKYHTLFFSKIKNMSQKLSSAAVVIGALRVMAARFRFVDYKNYFVSKF